MKLAVLVAAAAAAVAACSHSTSNEPAHAGSSPTAGAPALPPAAPPPARHTLTIIGTNDLHGALDRLPLIAGYIANVRAARAADGGGVIVVDGGDLFQGTLESNLAEGADVVRAYNEIGYTASAIGNHEFDYGPVGPAVTVQKQGDDPRGALKARIAEAKFPFLCTNIIDDATGKLIAWPNVAPGKLVEAGGVKIGIVGASTISTPFTTMPANFVGLKVTPAAAAIEAEAKVLREQGAQVIVAIAHLGSECKDLDHPDDTSTCDKKTELFDTLDALPQGTIDVFVAGHTHAAVAHVIDGVRVIESYSSGRAFGRIDLTIDHGKITGAKIYKPELPCPLDKEHNPVAPADCHPGAYEGKPVVADAAVQKIVDEAIAHAGSKRDEKLGVTLTGTITKSYGSESAEGDLVTELMLSARPEADVALTNGGGLRADLPAGALTYGQLFAAIPFDNRFAVVEITGKQLHEIVEHNLARGGGILSFAGLAAKATCKGDKLDVAVTVKGKPVADAKKYKVVTSDFLASGGDGLFGRMHLPPDAFHATDVIIRDALADALHARKGKAATIDPAAYAKKRLDYAGKRPVKCGKAGGDAGGDE